MGCVILNVLFILSSKKRPDAAVSLENKVFIKKLDIEHPYSLCEKGPSISH